MNRLTVMLVAICAAGCTTTRVQLVPPSALPSDAINVSIKRGSAEAQVVATDGLGVAQANVWTLYFLEPGLLEIKLVPAGAGVLFEPFTLVEKAAFPAGTELRAEGVAGMERKGRTIVVQLLPSRLGNALVRARSGTPPTADDMRDLEEIVGALPTDSFLAREVQEQIEGLRVAVDQEAVQPKFKGKSASQWVREWEENSLGSKGANEGVVAALVAIGEPAIPLVLQQLRAPKTRVLPVETNGGTRSMNPVGGFMRGQVAAEVAAKNAAIREFAVTTLGKIRPVQPEVVVALAEALRDEDVDVVRGAVEALGGIGPDAADAVPALAELLVTTSADYQTDYTCKLVANALGSIGQRAGAARTAFKAVIDQKDNGCRSAVMANLGKIGGAAAPVLAALLNDADKEQRAGALSSLEDLGPDARSGLPAMREALTKVDPDERLRLSRLIAVLDENPTATPAQFAAALDRKSRTDRATEEAAKHEPFVKRQIAEQSEPIPMDKPRYVSGGNAWYSARTFGLIRPATVNVDPNAVDYPGGPVCRRGALDVLPCSDVTTLVKATTAAWIRKNAESLASRCVDGELAVCRDENVGTWTEELDQFLLAESERIQQTPPRERAKVEAGLQGRVFNWIGAHGSCPDEGVPRLLIEGTIGPAVLKRWECLEPPRTFTCPSGTSLTSGTVSAFGSRGERLGPGTRAVCTPTPFCAGGATMVWIPQIGNKCAKCPEGTTLDPKATDDFREQDMLLAPLCRSNTLVRP